MSRCSAWLLVVCSVTAACTSDSTSGDVRTCRTDRDCNGGLCQAGICESVENPLQDGGVGGGDAGIGSDGGQAGDGGSTDGSVEDVPVVEDQRTDLERDAIEEDVAREDQGLDLGEENACGGTQPLDGEPGDDCGACEDGSLVCDGENALECRGASAENLCGGCGPLEAIPGTGCPDCDDGVWTCNEDGGLDCICEAIERDGTCAAPFLVELGEVETIDLCEQGDDEDPIAGRLDCRDVDVRGEDVVYEIVLAEATSLRIDLRDDDGVAIDTIVYLRTNCSDASSQAICSDDVPCEQSDVEASCSGDVQVRQSTLVTEELSAGTYFIVADHFAYTQNFQEYECGQVRLEVTEAP